MLAVVSKQIVEAFGEERGLPNLMPSWGHMRGLDWTGLKLAPVEGNAIEAWFVVTDALEEDMIIGMNVLGEDSGMEGFAILPKQGVLKLNRKGKNPLKFQLRPKASVQAIVSWMSIVCRYMCTARSMMR
jgi:hypothetical protein